MLEPLLVVSHVERQPWRPAEDAKQLSSFVPLLFTYGVDFLDYHHDRLGRRFSAVTLARHQEKPTRLSERHQRHLHRHRKATVGQSTIPRPERDPARDYLNPRPLITSHDDSVQRLEA